MPLPSVAQVGFLFGLSVATTSLPAAAQSDASATQSDVATRSDAATQSDVATRSDAAAARQLFDEARTLAKKGQYAEACPKFEQSYRADPGIGTLFNLADCWEHTGRIASAWRTFRDVADEAARSHQRDREQVALKRAQALMPRLPNVLVRVAASVEGLELLQDGVPLARVDLDKPFPIDPGKHSFEARAPGKRSWFAVLTAPPEGQAIEVVVPALRDAEQAPPAQIAAAPVARVAPNRESAAPALTTTPKPQVLVSSSSRAESESHLDRSARPGQTGYAYLVGGVGVAALAAGAFFGLRVESKNDEADKICPSNHHCTEQDQADLSRANEAARSARTMAYVSFGVGGAALATAVGLYFTAPQPNAHAWRLAPAIGSENIGAVLKGGF